MLVVTRHRLPLPGHTGVPAALEAARDVLAVLAEQPGYLRGWLARAVDDPDLLVLAHEWADVGSYRRALSAYDVTLRWPFLLTADDEATAFEVLVSRTPGSVVEQSSARGEDADTIGLGHAAAPRVSRGDFDLDRRIVRFSDLADGGHRLAELLTPEVLGEALVVSIGEGGQVTGRAVAAALGIDVVPVRTSRTDGAVAVDLEAVDVDGRTVVVIDDGVESGTAALAAGAALRAAGAVRVVLAVPVCPRAVEASLRTAYDDVIAVTKPLERISLHEHYDTFA